jgi:hypothetical protein
MKVFLDKTDTTHDALLDVIIDQVSARIETELNRKLTKQVRTEFFNGGMRYYYLSAYPIDSGTLPVIKVDGTTKTKDSDYWVWDEEGLIQFQTAPSASKPQIVEITWTGGYTETAGVLSVPDDLARAALMQGSFDFRRRIDLGSSSVGMPDGSVSVQSPASLLDEVKKIIQTYRKVPTIQ